MQMLDEKDRSDRGHARRKKRRWRDVSAWLAPLAIAGAFAGCSQVIRQGGFEDVQKSVAERGIAESVAWRDGSAEDQEAEEAVRTLLALDLTVDGAVQVALLENPSLQATYEELGVAQANLVQAGMLKNPVLFGSTLFGGVSPAYDFDVAQSFLDGLLVPARKRIAGAAFEEARLRVGGEIFDLAAKVRVAYYRLQGAEQLVRILETMAEASGASAEFAERLHAAGNLSDLDVANERALLEEMRADLLRAKAHTVEPREELRRLLGLSDSEAAFTVPAALPALPDSDPRLSELLALAKEQRLELAAGRKRQDVLGETLETAHFWRYLGGVEVGAMTHREQGENNWITGPSLAFELPIFDQRQAELARLESELRQSERRTEALTLDVSAEVRRAYELLRAARAIAEHDRSALIPARERALALTQEQYDFMLSGTFDLLTAKRTEIAAYRDYVEAVRDYWIAVAELERAVGARIPIQAPAKPLSLGEPSSGAPHHHHGGH